MWNPEILTLANASKHQYKPEGQSQRLEIDGKRHIGGKWNDEIKGLQPAQVTQKADWKDGEIHSHNETLSDLVFQTFSWVFSSAQFSDAFRPSTQCSISIEYSMLGFSLLTLVFLSHF